MRKFSLTLVSFAVLIFVSAPQTAAQQTRVPEREAEWNQYVLPQSTFVRQTDEATTVLLQIPSDWKRQQSENLSFATPQGATLTLFIGKIPDGLPLRDYVAAVMQPLRGLPDGADSMVVRRTTISGLEAREIMFEVDSGTEEVSRRVIWTTVSGPTALSLLLIEPVARVAEVEPYFKAVVQSATLVEKSDYNGFAALRSTAIKVTNPTRVDEVQSLAASFAALDGLTRKSNIARLASIFASSPDTAIDLLLDGRPMVRAAAVEAVVQSQNNALEKFVLRALDDRELYVAQQAARSIAANPEAIGLLRSHSFEWFNIDSVARVWPFLSKQNQIKILNEIFAQPLIPEPSPAGSPGSTLSRKPDVSVRATVLPPGSPPPPVKPFSQLLTPTSEPSRQLNALTLLRDVPAADFKLPLAAILAAKNDKLTTLALQIAWVRQELVPAPQLLQLLSSSNSEVSRLAALNLGQSGSVADIKSIEPFLDKPPAAAATPTVTADSKPVDLGPTLNDNLQLTITKIRLREQLATASGQTRQQLIEKGLADPKLTEWVWYRFVKNHDEERANAESQPERARTPVVQPLGENIFPKNVTYYAALPQPSVALDKFSSALDGLQLESARSQANLVLVLSTLREQLAQKLDSPPGASPIVYSGININEPIAFASWYAEGAPRGVPSAERKAIVLRVTDRARFERLLTLYQRSIGNFEGLTDYFSGGLRLLTVLPAILPLSAKAILSGAIKPPEETPFLKYSFVGGTEWNGYSIKVVEQRKVDSGGHLSRDSAYLTYLGDTAVLAPDLDSLRDVLTRAGSEQETLAANPSFRQVREKTGEAIYLSNLSQLIASPTDKQVSPSKGEVTESGALKISNTNWENLYQIRFGEQDWLKPFIGFQPGELASPRELLPRTTVAYYFMNFDMVAGWQDWLKQVLSAEERKELTSIWAIDFEKEVLPELGPECGVAVLGLPDIFDANVELPWAAFFKLKSDKIARALAGGKLLNGGAAGTDPIQIKLKSGDLFVAVKGNFLVLSRNRLGFAALDQPEKLIASRDFSRAAKLVPAGVVAFGGYNLEAAISAVGNSGADSVKTQQSSMISSLANAFHSPNFYATATSDTVEGRFSLSMDREGRYSVSELASLSRDFRLTYAQLEPRGVPIQNQERLSSLKLRIRANAAGEIDHLKEDVSSPHQTAEKISDRELELKILARHTEPKTNLTLPIKDPAFAIYLQPASESGSDDKSVMEKAHSIAGEEHDAWQVARKLTDWTYKNLKWKRVDSATTQQTLATLEADCLEFSQLYVAMARSLGLPARIVTGMAFGGASFGGHAWVEVYVGEWIEVDPTWGTDFVDATHIRDSAKGALLTYAALNLVQLEVLEAPRGVAEFQKDPRALAAKLSQELPRGNLTALTSALDLAVLTNETPGFATWDSLSDTERELMSSGYRRLLNEINGSFRSEADPVRDFRLLQVREDGDTAEAVAIEPDYEDDLLKFYFVRRNDAWFLTEILQADYSYHIIAETLQPTIRTILDRRSNKAARRQSNSEFVRVLLAMPKDPQAAIAIADRALKDDPKNQGLRHLKAVAFDRNEKSEDAIRLWQELAADTKPFAPSLLKLAKHYATDDDAEKRKLAIEFFNRYAALMPEDPRTHVALANVYDRNEDTLHAEVEHRAALKADPANTDECVDFAAFLAFRRRFQEASVVIDEASKSAGATGDFFGDLMTELYFADDKTIPEGLARNQPQRMEQSALANLYLAYVRLESGKSLLAIPLLKKAAALRSDWADPYVAMARAYRNLRNWTAAVKFADTAIRVNAKDSDAHYQRACAMARLGRVKEALGSLTKAFELDPDMLVSIGEEADLKILASQPAFKKLVAGQKE